MNNVKTTKELKEIILNNGMTIESTGFKGRYKVISKDGLLCKIVRFSNAKPCSYATINILNYDSDNREVWRPMYLEGFIKEMAL